MRTVRRQLYSECGACLIWCRHQVLPLLSFPPVPVCPWYDGDSEGLKLWEFSVPEPPGKTSSRGRARFANAQFGEPRGWRTALEKIDFTARARTRRPREPSPVLESNIRIAALSPPSLPRNFDYSGLITG